ncbi:tetratricopeptide repeat protein 9C [Nerophis lumbriciformis]|uniref:tetratricopeptide repeat protein 9C n=1 Tax=Nerophis lumbriciformis TaxID=546530 RepID=UPI002ADFF65D|nr:tetratricopeptide repeat protein 9C-like [Nerophis lumbriciformis]XP_061786679.1 tetratricopeptide repeat protein 9C-like [Nerophis lumbriciformis]XP_061786680.1 tetratricopeptide repeat protein 9C-like [Nerophis lumbriciformis]XP_061786681.1 tetratricopeptide repeat protein 9C-like [Nerophis lumbriciformis]XP_061786682.1 tetratricopeptide repeat protein 9C-like [Nerophis lumbriciformis]
MEEASPHLQGAAAASFPSVKPIWALLEDAGQMKTEGNAFYREKNIRGAVGRYHRALLVLRSLDSEVTSALKGFGPKMPALTAEQETLLRSTQVDCYNNLAACLLQRETVDYARVQEYSLRVLERRPGDAKALYRAGVATLELGDAQRAKQYLTQACKMQPNDTNIRRYLQRVEEDLSRELLKEKAMYRGMFASSTKSSSGVPTDAGGDFVQVQQSNTVMKT